jgi:hypothetical protein
MQSEYHLRRQILESDVEPVQKAASADSHPVQPR